MQSSDRLYVSVWVLVGRQTDLHAVSSSGTKEGTVGMCRGHGAPRCAAGTAAMGVLTDVHIGLVLDVMVFKIAQLFVLAVQVPSRSLDHSASWVRVCRGVP